MPASPVVAPFFDEATNAVTYLVADPGAKAAAVIDPVFDYDHRSGALDTQSVERVMAAAREAGYRYNGAWRRTRTRIIFRRRHL